MTFLAKPYPLTNKIQPYAWGERGKSAYIAQLLGLDAPDDAPFAELWMGTHPLGMSSVEYDGETMPLAELVARFPLDVLGERVAAAFGNQFPFLLKILSANEPLSIQVHPSKDEAVRLHAKDPAHYPDANHKPEIAIALDRLHALAGLRPARQIESLLERHPELGRFVADGTFSGQPRRALPKLAFLSLMRNALAKPGEMAQVIDQLAERFSREKRRDYREKLFLEMRAKYPGDVGLLSIFFLKLHRLRAGQAMFIPAGVPHAYLKSNMVECMSSSDNVIRAGLTPKFKDIPALLEVVTEKQVALYTPESADFVYTTPVSEFRVRKVALETGQEMTDTNDGVRVMLVLRGRLRLAWQAGKLEVGRGASVLLPGSLRKVEVVCLEASELYVADVPK